MAKKKAKSARGKRRKRRGDGTRKRKRQRVGQAGLLSISTRMTPELWRRVHIFAATKGVDLQEVIAEAVVKYIKKKK